MSSRLFVYFVCFIILMSIFETIWAKPLKSTKKPKKTAHNIRSKNFFGVRTEDDGFGESKYDKNCFFSPVNCVLYKSKVPGMRVVLRRRPKTV